jgi:hypothetical protein
MAIYYFANFLIAVDLFDFDDRSKDYCSSMDVIPELFQVD